MFARDSLHIQEASLAIGERLSMYKPSIDKLKLLSFCFSLYHAVRNDPGCVSADGMITDSCTVQYRATGLARSVRHFVGG